MKYYLIIVNLISFILFGIDKRYAVAHKWRIKEATLFFFALIGGSIGAYLGMQIFHHKTKKNKFAIFIPLIIIIQAYLYFRIFI